MVHRMSHSFDDIKAHAMGQPPFGHNVTIFINGVLFDNAEQSKDSIGDQVNGISR